MQLIMLSNDSSTRPCFFDAILIDSRGRSSSAMSPGKLSTVKINSVANSCYVDICSIKSCLDYSSRTTLNLSQNFWIISLQGSTPPIRSRIDSLFTSNPLFLRPILGISRAYLTYICGVCTDGLSRFKAPGPNRSILVEILRDWGTSGDFSWKI